MIGYAQIASLAVGGTLLLGSMGANWWLWEALQGEQQDKATAQANVERCAADNEDNQDVIDDLNEELTSCVQERAAERARWADASARRSVQLAELEERLEREAREREQSYEGDCEDWADQPVCPAVADRLRRD